MWGEVISHILQFPLAFMIAEWNLLFFIWLCMNCSESEKIVINMADIKYQVSVMESWWVSLHLNYLDIFIALKSRILQLKLKVSFPLTNFSHKSLIFLTKSISGN